MTHQYTFMDREPEPRPNRTAPAMPGAQTALQHTVDDMEIVRGVPDAPGLALSTASGLENLVRSEGNEQPAGTHVLVQLEDQLRVQAEQGQREHIEASVPVTAWESFSDLTKLLSGIPLGSPRDVAVAHMAQARSPQALSSNNARAMDIIRSPIESDKLDGVKRQVASIISAPYLLEDARADKTYFLMPVAPNVVATFTFSGRKESVRPASVSLGMYQPYLPPKPAS